MSVHVSSLIWKLPKTDKLNISDKLVLLKLSDHANDDAIAYPSQSTIARETWLNRATVNKSIAKLKQMDWIKVTGLKDKGNLIIAINLPAIRKEVEENEKLEKATGGVARGNRGCGERQQGGVARGNTNHQLTVNEPSIEPSIEPSTPYSPPDGGEMPDLKKHLACQEKDDGKVEVSERGMRLVKIFFPERPSNRRKVAEAKKIERAVRNMTEEDLQVLEKFYKLPKSPSFDRTWNRKSTISTFISDSDNQVTYAKELCGNMQTNEQIQELRRQAEEKAEAWRNSDDDYLSNLLKTKN